MTDRPSWDEYFTNIATMVATRSTCDRKSVGAIIVRDKSILATGYNGAARGLDHCSEVGHLMVAGHCTRVIHAEVNAILQAAKNGVSINKATLYCTASPCFTCFNIIVNSGISRVVYKDFYREERIFEIAKKLDIELIQYA